MNAAMSAVLTVLTMLPWGASPASTSADAGAIKLDHHRQLFIDDYLLADMQGVKRVLNQPRKHPANPLIRPDRPWEGGWIDMAAPPVIVGDEIRIYYGGMRVTHGDRKFLHAGGDDLAPAMAKSKTIGGIGAIGLATLRLDGWVSVDAGRNGGTLTTNPLILAGKELVINAQAPAGSVAVEILDNAGNPMLGYRKEDCAVFRGDAIRHPVAWRGKPDLSQLAGKVLRIRFHLKSAKLYSFVSR